MTTWMRIRCFFFSLIFLLLFLFGCSPEVPSDTKASSSLAASVSASSSGQAAPSRTEHTGLTVHFIDVGQGDSILAESEGHFMLIDAGENDQGEKVVEYLTQAGVSSLDYVIGTHPHSDHIGGLDDVIRAFPVNQVILPQALHTTQTFEDVLDAISEKGLKITRPIPGDSYSLGEAAFTILAPQKDYGEDLNNWSVGIRLTFGGNAFVMCGDAEAEAEADILKSGLELKADVLKVGHHGSRTSTSSEFLQRVSPDWAVIPCGAGNSYGHPHQETLDQLQKAGIHVLRTDQQGTLIAFCNGTSVSWSSSGQEASVEDRLYVLNLNTKKFHLPDCPSVDQMKTENRRDFSGSKAELTDLGYEPCGQCNP